MIELLLLAEAAAATPAPVSPTQCVTVPVTYPVYGWSPEAQMQGAQVARRVEPKAATAAPSAPPPDASAPTGLNLTPEQMQAVADAQRACPQDFTPQAQPSVSQFTA